MPALRGGSHSLPRLTNNGDAGSQLLLFSCSVLHVPTNLPDFSAPEVTSETQSLFDYLTTFACGGFNGRTGDWEQTTNSAKAGS